MPHTLLPCVWSINTHLHQSASHPVPLVLFHSPSSLLHSAMSKTLPPKPKPKSGVRNFVREAAQVHLTKQSLLNKRRDRSPKDMCLDVPNIWPAKLLGRIRDASRVVTKDQHQQQLLEIEERKQRMERECEERKRQLRAADRKRLEAAAGQADQSGQREQSDDDDTPGKVLDRAFVARQEQTAEVQRANRLIMAAKCHVIRDAQVAEKNELEREMRDEELRLELMMEQEREKGLREEDRRRAEHAQANSRHGIEIKNQLRERQLAKLVEAERIEEEAKAMAQGQIAITLDMLEREKERKLERLRMRTELRKANEMNDVFKSMAFEEQRIAEMKAAEFMRQKQERDRQRAADARLAKEARQREADRMLVLQQKMLDTKDDQEEMSMRRAQEEKEREFRRKQKEAAQLKQKRTQEMERARVEQLEEIKRQRALNMVREEIDFRGQVERLQHASEKERQVAEQKYANREKYRAGECYYITYLNLYLL